MDATTENSPPPRKRRWFQFHLSTAIVVMFVAGGLMWANLRVHDDGCFGISMVMHTTWSRVFTLGWPYEYLRCQKIEANTADSADDSGPHTSDYACPTVSPNPPSVSDLLGHRQLDGKSCFYSLVWYGLAIDLVAGIVALATTAIIAEWCCRRLFGVRSS